MCITGCIMRVLSPPENPGMRVLIDTDHACVCTSVHAQVSSKGGSIDKKIAAAGKLKPKP